MRVLESLEAFQALNAGGESVVTVGNFDGVHRAHQQLLQAVCREARADGRLAVAVSFEPHPSRILRPQQAPPLITPRPQRLRWIEAAAASAGGLDALVLLPFSRDLSLLSPLEFAEQVLVRGLRARALHEGANFRFGRGHAGDMALLAELGTEFHFAVRCHPELRLRGAPVSSSRVRALLAAGAVGPARALLGRPFSVCGLVARGRGVGRQRTVPTLNLQHYDELLPQAGVYATCARLADREKMAALTNVGVRPTFGEGGALTVETHVLEPPSGGLDPALGTELEIAFLRRVRDEHRFASPEDLRRQIAADVTGAQRYFRRIGLR
ncbi:MAG: riboflavin biosynthesis protein RibF [Terriglobales bacterium]